MSKKNNPNRLIKEKSPYLLQHAYNPVEWFPWGEEAFEKARREDKPVLVSIGYSTCHWCHVMEQESFEDEETAALMNERFVAIKVDREERPDIDSIYMQVCQLMNGHGGWPLNVFLTPDAKPFYAGTYFPKESRFGMPPFREVIIQLHRQYKENKEEIETIAHEAAEALRKSSERFGDSFPDTDILDRTFQQLAGSFDSEYGGFGEAPKFSMPHTIMFLLKYFKWKGIPNALIMAEKTLQAMADGGIFDQIGFGFARYSTDREWLVPHFEKMLYDNALLLYCYSEAYQLTKNQKYKEIASRIVTFAEREMANEEGAFFSALDADSEGIEGKYYVWDKAEILEVLGEKDGAMFCSVYGIISGGNFEGKNIPNLIQADPEKVFETTGYSPENGWFKLEECRQILLNSRSGRVYPHLDDKVLTAWNGLMAAGLAKAGQAFQNKYYVELAGRAARFIEEKLMMDGKLLARYRDGEPKFSAYLDDWAFLLWAYIELYESTYSHGFLDKAVKAAGELREKFWDKEGYGFYFTSSEAEELLVRQKEGYDGAIPSGNSVAALQLLKLGHLTGDTSLMDMAYGVLKAFKYDIENYGQGHTFMLQALMLMEYPVREVVIAGTGPEKDRLLELLQEQYTPGLAVVAAGDEDRHRLEERGYKEIGTELTVYICQNFTCKQPLTDYEEAKKQLGLY